MRQPTVEERSAERALTDPVIADFATNTLLLVTGIVAGSLSLLGEGIRSFIMLAASVYAVFVLRAIHRGRLDRFQFGVDKIERFTSLVVGLCLVVSGLWVAHGTIKALFDPGPAASSLWLVLAAIANATNTAVNIAGWWGMRAVASEEPSELFRTQLRARFTMMASSLFLQMTLTAAALAKDPALATGFDALGAAFVATLMLVRGAGMLSAALPHILDVRADPGLADRIHNAAAAVLPGGHVVDLRTRPFGDGAQAELRIAVDDATSAAVVADWRSDILAQLTAGADRVDLALVVVSENGPATGRGTPQRPACSDQPGRSTPRPMPFTAGDSDAH